MAMYILGDTMLLMQPCGQQLTEAMTSTLFGFRDASRAKPNNAANTRPERTRAMEPFHQGARLRCFSHGHAKMLKQDGHESHATGKLNVERTPQQGPEPGHGGL